MILTGGATALGLVAVALVAVGLAAGRPDVVVLAVPFLLTAVGAATTAPRRTPDLAVRARSARSETGEVRASLAVGDAAGAESLVLRLAAPGYRSREALLAGGPAREVPVALDTARTGVHRLFRADAFAESVGAVLVCAPAQAGPVAVTIRPVLRALRELPMPFRLAGLTGAHTSRRVGDGYEMHDVHEFAPGDRMRRIDWRVSARRSLDPRTGRLGTLYARRTFATADATVMLVVDSRDDVGPDVAGWAGGADVRVDETTSLDLAREAAASLARAFLDGGDRVGLDDLGRRRRPVRPGAGRGQWERIMQRLVRVAPEGWPDARQRAPQVPTGALVLLCSTFLDDEAARMARQWRAHGHRVVAVDTLPELTAAYLTGGAEWALRLVLLERRQRLRALGRAGVETVRWVGTPAVGLTEMARSRTAGERR